MAARHLLGRGYKAFMVVTQDVVQLGVERVAGFREVARDCKVGVIRQQFVFRSGHSTFENVSDFVEELAGVIDDYPMETGIFATNDWVAGIVQRTLKDRFPERLHTTAVLGVDNEQQNWWYLGPLAELSSVVPAFREMGAAAIDWLIDHPGDKASAEGLLRRFPPKGVVERASTAGGACGDPLTAQMIRWAWTRVRMEIPVSVADLAAKFHMSRRTLDRKFREYYGKPAGEFLLDLRMDLARHLLRTTDLAIGEISSRCGYAKQDVLTRRIRAEFGCTPKEYRARLRDGAAAENR